MGAGFFVLGKVALSRDLSTLGITGKNLAIYYCLVNRVVTDWYTPVLLENLYFQTSPVAVSSY